MIKITLKDVLEKKGISINELSQKTGISRTSLTPLINGTSKMIKFDTLNKLVYVLKVGLGQILDYVPDTDIDVSNFKIDYDHLRVDFLFKVINEVSESTIAVPQSANFSIAKNILTFDMFQNSTQEEVNTVWNAIFEVAEATGYYNPYEAVTPLINFDKTQEFLKNSREEMTEQPPHSKEDKSFKDMSVFSDFSYQVGTEMDDAFFPYEVEFLTTFLEAVAKDSVVNKIEQASFEFSPSGFTIFNWHVKTGTETSTLSTQIRNAMAIKYELESRTNHD